MPDHLPTSCTAFEGHRLLHSGPLVEVALAVKTATDGTASQLGAGPILVFDDVTGRIVDLDLRGNEADIVARLSLRPQRSDGPAAPAGGGPSTPADAQASGSRGPGRPKLGVVAREVTLLPRHWAWLATQPAGASAALRRLVDEARRSSRPLQERRAAQQTAYRFMVAIGGDLPGFEEATRALFADDRPRLESHLRAWPRDVRAHALRLAFPAPPRP